ncbi:DUF3866 family protein [Nocardiopsis alba]|jgi:hypothetical protein|uniref:DUF3866 family protein n=2 Tax=Nocardiopsis alba TaxID=53437 RepID=A0A7K2IXM2_9ACTN|nr:DUF3866 family protein [Nocardiopsis alba]AFR09295.1 hypothetical protein B005_4105 [Nocardiopsis alba ATCC BAA-2165]MYR34740.1 DUF3866 family protein [Nocardiopsis alba]
MIRWRRGEVRRLLPSWPGVLLCSVSLSTDEANDEEEAPTCRALAYPELVGTPEVGDSVLLNTGALDLGLGTGGYALVVALPDRLPPDHEGPGHLVKARYTPLQATVLGADEQGSPHHEILRSARGVDDMPVVVADLHSALPAVLAGIRSERPGTRVVNVMLDGGALPAAFSQVIGVLRENDLLAGCVTTGQAFGGDLEAVTVHSGLLAARHVLGAEIAVVCQGPGNLGTGTPWGFSGVACGEALNAAAVLGGRPVAALRVSEADPRPRHQGVSHHSLTAYGRVALAPSEVVVPDLPGIFGEHVRDQAWPLGERHTLVEVPVTGLEDEIRSLPVKVSTMGRGLEEDRAAFLSSAAAGRHAASLLRP